MTESQPYGPDVTRLHGARLLSVPDQDLPPMHPIAWPKPVNNAITDIVVAAVAFFSLGLAVGAFIARSF